MVAMAFIRWTHFGFIDNLVDIINIFELSRLLILNMSYKTTFCSALIGEIVV